MKYLSHKFVIAFLMLFLPLGALAVLSGLPAVQLTKAPSISSGQTYFAEVDRSGIVLHVIVADQEFIDSGKVGNPKNWISATRNNSKYDANPGDKYDINLDAFIAPKPTATATLNTTTFRWDVPNNTQAELVRSRIGL